MRKMLFAAGAAALMALSATPASAQSREGFGTGSTRASACSNAKARAEHKVLMAGYEVSSFSSCTCSEAGQYASSPWECTADAYYSRRTSSSGSGYSPPPRYRAPSAPLPPLPTPTDAWRPGNP